MKFESLSPSILCIDDASVCVQSNVKIFFDFSKLENSFIQRLIFTLIVCVGKKLKWNEKTFLSDFYGFKNGLKKVVKENLNFVIEKEHRNLFSWIKFCWVSPGIFWPSFWGFKASKLLIFCVQWKCLEIFSECQRIIITIQATTIIIMM